MPAPSAGRGGRGGGAAAPRGYPGPGALSAPRSGAASRGRRHLRPRGGWERGRGGGRNPPPARTRPFGAPERGTRGCSAGVCATEGRGEAEIFVSHFPRELRARGLLCSLFIWIVIFSFFNYYFVFFTLVEIPAHGEDLLEDRART